MFDFALRENLRQACDVAGYDKRNLYTASYVDGAGGSGFNAVTFVDNHDFRDNSQQIHNDKLLAYAYILTNNKLGVPSVFYPDFYGATNYRGAIKGLMKLHRNYIYGATAVDYLNKSGNIWSGTYTSGSPDKTLLYQTRNSPSGRDVVMAINFSDVP